MSLFRSLTFSRRSLPDRFQEISERVYVFDCCLSPKELGEDEYKSHIDIAVANLQRHHAGASFMVFNFKEGEDPSLLSDLLAQHEMTVVDYPRHNEGYPIPPLEMIHYFLRSSESWLSLEGQKNVILMHCERGAWPVLAFMLAGFVLYNKKQSGEQRALEMMCKKAPKELLTRLSAINPRPSQIRYLKYISERSLIAEWPPSDAPLVIDSLVLMNPPLFDGGKGFRPAVHVYGQGPTKNSKRPKLLFSSLMSEEPSRYYDKEECLLVNLGIDCRVQGDVFLECIHLGEDLVTEEKVFKVMFHTAFVQSCILSLGTDEVDILWNPKIKLPNDFKAEVFFSKFEEVQLSVAREVTSSKGVQSSIASEVEKPQEVQLSVDREVMSYEKAQLGVASEVVSSKEVQLTVANEVVKYEEVQLSAAREVVSSEKAQLGVASEVASFKEVQPSTVSEVEKPQEVHLSVDHESKKAELGAASEVVISKEIRLSNGSEVASYEEAQLSNATKSASSTEVQSSDAREVASSKEVQPSTASKVVKPEGVQLSVDREVVSSQEVKLSVGREVTSCEEAQSSVVNEGGIASEMKESEKVQGGSELVSFEEPRSSVASEVPGSKSVQSSVTREVVSSELVQSSVASKEASSIQSGSELVSFQEAQLSVASEVAGSMSVQSSVTREVASSELVQSSVASKEASSVQSGSELVSFKEAQLSVASEVSGSKSVQSSVTREVVSSELVQSSVASEEASSVQDGSELVSFEEAQLSVASEVPGSKSVQSSVTSEVVSSKLVQSSVASEEANSDLVQLSVAREVVSFEEVQQTVAREVVCFEDFRASSEMASSEEAELGVAGIGAGSEEVQLSVFNELASLEEARLRSSTERVSPEVVMFSVASEAASSEKGQLSVASEVKEAHLSVLGERASSKEVRLRFASEGVSENEGNESDNEFFEAEEFETADVEEHSINKLTTREGKSVEIYEDRQGNTSSVENFMYVDDLIYSDVETSFDDKAYDGSESYQAPKFDDYEASDADENSHGDTAGVDNGTPMVYRTREECEWEHYKTESDIETSEDKNDNIVVVERSQEASSEAASLHTWYKPSVYNQEIVVVEDDEDGSGPDSSEAGSETKIISENVFEHEQSKDGPETDSSRVSLEIKNTSKTTFVVEGNQKEDNSEACQLKPEIEAIVLSENMIVEGGEVGSNETPLEAEFESNVVGVQRTCLDPNIVSQSSAGVEGDEVVYDSSPSVIGSETNIMRENVFVHDGSKYDPEEEASIEVGSGVEGIQKDNAETAFSKAESEASILSNSIIVDECEDGPEATILEAGLELNNVGVQGIEHLQLTASTQTDIMNRNVAKVENLGILEGSKHNVEEETDLGGRLKPNIVKEIYPSEVAFEPNMFAIQGIEDSSAETTSSEAGSETNVISQKIPAMDGSECSSEATSSETGSNLNNAGKVFLVEEEGNGDDKSEAASSEAGSENITVSRQILVIAHSSKEQDVKVVIEPKKTGITPEVVQHKKNRRKPRLADVVAKVTMQRRIVSMWVPRAKEASPENPIPKPPVYKWVPKESGAPSEEP